MNELIIGTRGSALALWQAETVQSLLRSWGVASRIKVIKTTGDLHQTGPLADHGGKGLFVKELESALLSGDVDLAVHSLKDVPCVLSDGFELAAFLPRADARDCLIAPRGVRSIRDLPPEARVGSCSPRRISQALHTRPDLCPEDLRGNVETRLGKVREGILDATFLAKAGLERLGISDPDLIHPLPMEVMLPAAGQGIVAVEIRSDRTDVHTSLQKLDDAPARAAAEAEREVVRRLGGTCVSPIAVLAVPQGNRIRIQSVVGDPGGRRLIRADAEGDVEKRVQTAGELADQLVALGAWDILHSGREGRE